MRFIAISWLFLLIISCQPSSPSSSNQYPPWYAEAREDTDFHTDYHKVLDSLSSNRDTRRLMCSQSVASYDPVRRAFCDKDAPVIKSLRDLQQLLKLDLPLDISVDEYRKNRDNYPSFAITGHSTSLVTRFVSPINPRVIIFNRFEDDFVVMGFVRGDQFVELIAQNPVSKQLNFFLLKFTQQCNIDSSCSPADLQTSKIENDWLDVKIYDDSILANTVFDCTHCHQPEGLAQQKILRMQESEQPWLHFFKSDTQGQELLAYFNEFHGENYALGGLPGNLLSESDPRQLSELVKSFSPEQPNKFSSSIINENNGGPSEAWIRGWQNYLSGEFIPFPSWKNNIMNMNVFTELKAEWDRWKLAEIEDHELTSLTSVVDDQLAPTFGVRPPSNVSDEELLRLACQRCHNSKLDRTLGKSLFRVDDIELGEVEIAINRLELLKTDPESSLVMPPKLFMDLTDQEIDRLISYLKSLLN